MLLDWCVFGVMKVGTKAASVTWDQITLVVTPPSIINKVACSFSHILVFIYDDYICKCFGFHLFIADRSYALICCYLLFLIAGTNQADLVREGAT